MRRLAVLTVLGAGLAAIAAPAQAGETLPRDIAQRLDRAPVAFSMTAAKRERLMIIQENMARQRYYGGYGYSYGTPGYGYGTPGYGYAAPYGYADPYGYGGAYGYYGRHSQRPLTGLERGYYGR